MNKLQLTRIVEIEKQIINVKQKDFLRYFYSLALDENKKDHANFFVQIFKTQYTFLKNFLCFIVSITHLSTAGVCKIPDYNLVVTRSNETFINIDVI